VVEWNGKVDEDDVLVSHTGHRLVRPVSFRFALDPNRAQSERLFMFAGARRFCFNHHVARVKANLEARSAERDAGLDREAMTPALSWSRQSFINEFNAWKNGLAPDSPVTEVVGADSGELTLARGLMWRDEVSADVFECASVDAAQAFRNYADSVRGARAGIRIGFPYFKAKHSTTPSFRLRSKSMPGETGPVRFPTAKTIRFPKLGEVRVHGCARKLRRMVAAGRFHIHSATVRFEQGRWWVSVNGVAAEFHHQRRSPKGRHPAPAGLDLGVKHLAVLADAKGQELEVWEGVNALLHAQQRLRRANKALARTKPGSTGRAKARVRLTRVHARIAHLRRDLAHRISHWLATNLVRLTVEDLNVAGMARLRTLARAVADAGLGDLLRQIAYKTAWYGCELHVADRWYPSSKTCSACGHVKGQLLLSERAYQCDDCGQRTDRDRNAAINLARWPDQHSSSPPLACPSGHPVAA
jgi:putative transposase